MGPQLQVFLFLILIPHFHPFLLYFCITLILVYSIWQHGAIRTTLSGPADYINDDESGFQRIEAREIDTIG